ncbi:hypothetical protein EDD22DRAFT_951079 [Suillus occidentalis]|nr:hypothetical protein EDD22DRAFT_951079 [Suillus occidentalis]
MPDPSHILNEDFNRSVDSGFVDVTVTTRLPAAAVATPSRLSPNERVKSVINILREGRMSILDFILRILDPSQPDFVYNRDWILVMCKARLEAPGQPTSAKLPNYLQQSAEYIRIYRNDFCDKVTATFQTA